ncbi:MAG: OmpA family protein [Chitinophagaceae bacterium]|nr:OmpA family protein [Chitinophagaceae bacterium]
MNKYLVLLVCLFPLFAGAQKNNTDSSGKMATVDVTVTDMKGKPKKGEQVLFRGQRSGKLLTGVSDATGKIKQLLPPGDTWVVSLKAISDTTSYAMLEVPALEADEYFTEPFWVNIKFEPARRYRLDNVHFDTDKASLRGDSYAQLKELLEYLQHHDDIRVEIAGHTDNVGTDAHNLKLSQDRANTIRNYLIGKGIKAARLTAKGYGATEPVADNATAEGRQQNRRTEVRVL